MERNTRRSSLAALLAALTVGALVLAAMPGAAQQFDPDALLRNAAFKAELQTLRSDEQAQRSILGHANAGFGVTKTLFDFAAELADGQYANQIEIIMDVPVQKWSPNRGMYGSYDIVNVKRIVNQNSPGNLFGRVTNDMNNLATALSVYSVMKDVYAGYNGDSAARLNAIKGTYDLVSGYWAQRIGWSSVGTAMLGAGVISYALTSFQAEAQAQYTDYWWNSYSQWLEGEYPNLVSGPGSWVDIASSGGEAALKQRLYAFWDAPYENAIKYYGKAQLQTAPAMADLQMRDKFAAAYYNERVHSTLKTYFQKQAERAEAQAWYEAQKANAHLQQLVHDLQLLRMAIDDAARVQLDEEDEETATPVGLLLRPGASTIDPGETITLTAWFVYEDHTVKPAVGEVSFSGAASGPSFLGDEPGDFTIFAACNGLRASASVRVREKAGQDDEEEEIADAIEEIQDPEDEDGCGAASIAAMRGTLLGAVARVQSKASVVATYKTKFDKELADRAADPCGNSLMAYCYQQASLAAGDIAFLVDEVRELASSLLMEMALCPDAVGASGAPLTISDVIKDIADAGRARADAEASLSAMQSRLGENGCDESEFVELGDRYVEDGEDPDALQDGGNMVEIAGDGVDNDQDGQQEEDWSEVAGKTVTIVVYDSGYAADDSFDLSVSGLGSLGRTPVGGLRTYGLDLAPGTYTATVTVVWAPDHNGTFTMTAMQSGSVLNSISMNPGPDVGGSASMTFTVTAPE